jgi:6-pyruvoyltetrahydropterin/6-carboxytetrahydropterin synthase
MRLGISDYIDSAHFLPGHEKCGRLHGHTYKIDISIEGDHKQGMIVDFADLKKDSRAVLQQYDHGNWNDFLEYPSVENICDLLARRLKERLSFAFVLRVWEGHGKWAETSSAEVG